jgi:hypothetical protein
MTPHRSHPAGFRAALAAAVLAAAFALAGCGKPPVNLTLINTPLPNYTGVEPSVSATQQIAGRTVEVVKFSRQVPGAQGEGEKSGNSSKWPEKYVPWFKEKGWNLISQGEGVTALNWIYGKGEIQCTMSFSYTQGLVFTFTAPPKPAAGNPAPARAVPAK